MKEEEEEEEVVVVVVVVVEVVVVVVEVVVVVVEVESIDCAASTFIRKRADTKIRWASPQFVLKRVYYK